MILLKCGKIIVLQFSKKGLIRLPKKKPNRLFYTVKLTSGLLKEHKYNLDISFEECIKNSLIVSLADSQMLKSIRDITG